MGLVRTGEGPSELGRSQPGNVGGVFGSSSIGDEKNVFRKDGRGHTWSLSCRARQMAMNITYERLCKVNEVKE